MTVTIIFYLCDFLGSCSGSWYECRVWITFYKCLLDLQNVPIGTFLATIIRPFLSTKFCSAWVHTKAQTNILHCQKKKKKKNDGPLTTNCTAVLPYVPPTAATSTRGFGCWAAQHTACYSALMNRQLWRQQGWLNVACSREGNWRWPQNQHGHTREGKTGYAKNMSDCSRISGSRKTTLLNPKNKEMCV